MAYKIFSPIKPINVFFFFFYLSRAIAILLACWRSD